MSHRKVTLAQLKLASFALGAPVARSLYPSLVLNVVLTISGLCRAIILSFAASAIAILTRAHRHKIGRMLEPTKKPEDIDRSLSQGIRTGNVDTVRSCLSAGAKPTEEDIDEAESGKFPEVCKELIGAGAMDVNRDFGSGGDLLINAVWELKVSCIDTSSLLTLR